MIWRLIRDEPADGPTNMATDETLLVSASEGGPPTIRLYGWSPPTLSIGALQRVARAVRQNDGSPFPWVRRPSGGRAVWHDREVTYAIAASANHPLLTGSVRDSYRRIADALATALRSLGVCDVRIEPVQARRGASAACYDAPGDYEVSAGGRKIVGSAQVRRAGAVLQHGSIPIQLDIEALVRHLPVDERESAELSRQLRQRAAGLADLLPDEPTVESVTNAVISGLKSAGFEIGDGTLSEPERAIQRVLVERYRSDEWNSRR